MSQQDTARRAEALVEASEWPGKALMMAAEMSRGELIGAVLWLARVAYVHNLRRVRGGAPPIASEVGVNRAVLASAVGVQNRNRMWGQRSGT